MKIVIEVPDDEYKQMKDYPSVWNSHFERIIANGIPLPKGHGQLIDRTQALQEMAITPLNERNFNNCVEAVECVPTIVEADNETDN